MMHQFGLKKHPIFLNSWQRMLAPEGSSGIVQGRSEPHCLNLRNQFSLLKNRARILFK